ncbi:MAG TPA: HAD-IB family phosphatase [Bacteroidota bacterium]
MKLRVYCDFDGTVAKEDVGKELFSHFAGQRADEMSRQYLNGECTARECLLAEAEAVQDVTPETLAAFVDQFEIDGHFREFRDFCLSNNIPVTILSDGLDFYVRRILARNGLADCPSFANHLEFRHAESATTLGIEFPYTDSECEFCGNCKRNHMLALSGGDDIIVYVGDGISDRCPVRHADIVFAKKGLIKYCQQENISYFEFSTFRDVRERLASLLTKKRIKKRREAEMARRDVFMQG